MSSADSLLQAFGALELPVTSADVVDNSLAGLDPANGILSDLFKAAINAELGDGWAVLSAGSPPLLGSEPVQDKLQMEPTASHMQQRKAGWPLLCVYRNSEPATVDEIGIGEDRITQKWGVDYILGPLEIGDERKTRGALIAVAKAIVLTIRHGGHKAYQTESNGQAKQVLGRGYCGFASIVVTDFRLGAARFAEEGPAYNAMSMTLTTTETSELNEAAFPFYMGSNVNAGQGTDAGIIENFVDADTEHPG